MKSEERRVCIYLYFVLTGSCAVVSTINQNGRGRRVGAMGIAWTVQYFFFITFNRNHSIKIIVIFYRVEESLNPKQ